jgi:RimJ/RimL family protein N-acetyltransferase
MDILAEWTSKARTSRGQEICIRPLRADDRVREIGFLNSLSPNTTYFRLLTPLRYLSRHLLDQFMDVDYDQRMAFVATVMLDGVEEFVGLARYGSTEERDEAELGITVTDAWQRCGIARLLIRELIRFATFRGIRRLTGIVLPENERMLALAADLGFRAHYVADDRLMHISLDLSRPAARPGT